jgi:uncharacterized protein with GYD domain
MKAVVLLRANPGSEEAAYEKLESVAVPGVKVTQTMHVLGRIDGLVICEVEDLRALNGLAEEFRSGGTFHTETLISIED